MDYRDIEWVGTGPIYRVGNCSREVLCPPPRQLSAWRSVFLIAQWLHNGRDLALRAPVLAGFEAVTERIIGCAIEVHRHTGPGLLESVYEACLAREFKAAHLEFERQVALPIVYKGEPLDCAFRIDFVVAHHVLVEVKSVEHMLEVHKAQVITYLRLSGLPVGLLINFNVPVLRSGVRRLLRSPTAEPIPSP